MGGSSSKVRSGVYKDRGSLTLENRFKLSKMERYDFFLDFETNIVKRDVGVALDNGMCGVSCARGFISFYMFKKALEKAMANTLKYRDLYKKWKEFRVLLADGNEDQGMFDAYNRLFPNGKYVFKTSIDPDMGGRHSRRAR